MVLSVVIVIASGDGWCLTDVIMTIQILFAAGGV